MPFDPIDRHYWQTGPRPSPSASTRWHGMILAAGFGVIVLLLTMMLNITYSLEVIERIADAWGLS